MFQVAGVLLGRSRTWLSILLVVAVGCPSYATAMALHEPLGATRLPNGNTLIAEGGHIIGFLDGRVIEVDSLGRLVWAYLNCDVMYAHTGRRLANGNTLIASSYGNRVVEVDPAGNTVWKMNTGLSWPNEAYRLENGNTLITCRDNSRVLEVTPQHQVVWSYFNVDGPHNANRLANGHTLISDSNNNRVIEVDSSGNIVWQYATGLSWPRSAQRLDNGSTLIADTHHDRAIEVDTSGTIVWSVTGVEEPFTAVRLANGNTLLSGPSGPVEVTPSDSTVWQYPNTVAVVEETLHVVNPTSGCSLYVHIHRPAYAEPSHRVPGVIFVPGGVACGSWLDLISPSMPDDIASEGFAFLHFDPDGRGLSNPCPENYDGYVQQDGMHACLSLLASRDYVDTSRLCVFTQGYGITMGSGMIARYREPRVNSLLDFEGPADRSHTCLDSGGFVPVPADSDAFWQEREAGRFMKQAPGAYLRMQPQIDSNPLLWDNRHAIQLVDSATSVAHGGAGISAWTRVNDSVMNATNQVYTLSDPPIWMSPLQDLQDYARVLLYLHELAGMNPPGVADHRGIYPAASFKAMPRPCRGILQVGLPTGLGSSDLRVHDVCGRLVAQMVAPTGSTQATLDLRHLQPGVYYLSVAEAGTVPVVVVR
jgi:hypothetical protein